MEVRQDDDLLALLGEYAKRAARRFFRASFRAASPTKTVVTFEDSCGEMTDVPTAQRPHNITTNRLAFASVQLFAISGLSLYLALYQLITLRASPF